MRLIDADKLKVLVAVENNGVINTGKLITELFDEMETVEAIPVEWIKKWNIEHWECAVDGDDMMVDVMMEEWWQKNVDDQKWDDQWERHLMFERWMKDV